jgi:hypothetical protein
VQQALSGTRLKAYWYTAGDGAKQFAGKWFDSQLQMDCYMAPGKDGVTRCLPTFPTGPVLFSDAGCLTPVALAMAKASCGGEDAKWASFSIQDSSAGTCPTYKTLYLNLGGPFTGAAFWGTPASCLKFSTAADAGFNPYPSTTYDYRILGAAVDLSMFQTGTVGHD